MNRPSDRLPKLLAFVREYRRIVAALAGGGGRPMSDDVLLSAYDFRPREGVLRPPKKTIFKGLSYLGYRRNPGQDLGIFLSYYTDQVSGYLAHFTGVTAAQYEVAHLICAYRVYQRLADGELSQWKRLKTT